MVDTSHPNPWEEALPAITYHYLCTCKDLIPSRRADIAPFHRARSIPAHVTGRIIAGGAQYHQDPSKLANPLDPKEFSGSYLLIKATSTEDAKRIFTSDIYAREGVWDLSTVHIQPIIYGGKNWEVELYTLGEDGKAVMKDKEEVEKIKKSRSI